MQYHLVCVHPFGSFKRGDTVTAPDEMALLLSGPNAHFFVKRPAQEQAQAPRKK